MDDNMNEKLKCALKEELASMKIQNRPIQAALTDVQISYINAVAGEWFKQHLNTTEWNVEWLRTEAKAIIRQAKENWKRDHQGSSEVLQSAEAQVSDKQNEKAPRVKLKKKSTKKRKKPTEMTLHNISDESTSKAIVEMISEYPGWTVKTYADNIKNADPKKVMRLIYDMIENGIISTETRTGKTKQYTVLRIEGIVYEGKRWSLRQLAAHPDNRHNHSKSTLHYRLSRGWNVNDALQTPITANYVIDK
jgi:hypothetical protein